MPSRRKLLADDRDSCQSDRVTNLAEETGTLLGGDSSGGSSNRGGRRGSGAGRDRGGRGGARLLGSRTGGSGGRASCGAGGSTLARHCVVSVFGWCLVECVSM